MDYVHECQFIFHVGLESSFLMASNIDKGTKLMNRTLKSIKKQILALTLQKFNFIFFFFLKWQEEIQKIPIHRQQNRESIFFVFINETNTKNLVIDFHKLTI